MKLEISLNPTHTHTMSKGFMHSFNSSRQPWMQSNLCTKRTNKCTSFDLSIEYYTLLWGTFTKLTNVVQTNFNINKQSVSECVLCICKVQ